MADVATAPRALPRGPHNLTRDDVLASQRGRMLEAMAAAVAVKSYAATTVGDVVAAAGVSRKTFYEHFRDKEECFLAAYEAGVDTLLSAIVSAQPEGPGWLALIHAQTRAYVGILAANPAFARTFLIDVFAAGPRALERHAEVHARFGAALRDLHLKTQRDFPDFPDVPSPVFTAAVGALNEIVSGYVREGRTAALPELEDTLVYIQVALFAGRSAAGALGVPAP
jgi:AcrR family transcriptional regulator